MKTKDLEVGARVMHGKRTDMQDGKEGEDAYVIAVGFYTETTGPCGRAVMPYRGRYDRSPRVVIAVERKKYVYADDDEDGHYESVWEPRVVTIRTLMDPAEYRVKADVIRKQARRRREHELRGEHARAEAAQLIAERLGGEIDDVHVRWSREGVKRNGKYKLVWRPKVIITADQLEKIVGKRRLEDLVSQVRDWEAEPDPDTCTL